ncbi:MAG TPA: nuclear transport factor 2 family protein [Stellaceae bacterium]|nr:nuclear transport factor 2 family protein [Stellaceae bacterium]
MVGMTLTSLSMEALMRRYFDGCNEADLEKVIGCFVPDAIHYFPPGMYEGPFRGGQKIAEKWKWAVENLGSHWTVDRICCDPEHFCATMEWTHFKTRQNMILRGIEWYDFDPATGLIREIRAYYASPQDPKLTVLALEGFDYQGRGYPMNPAG